MDEKDLEFIKHLSCAGHIIVFHLAFHEEFHGVETIVSILLR